MYSNKTKIILLDMYNFFNNDLSVQTTQEQIDETYYQIRQTKKKYGDKLINDIYRDVFISVKNTFPSVSSLENSEHRKNFCDDCVILQVIRNIQYNKPIQFI